MTAHREGRAARPEPSLGQRFESALQSLLPRESRIFGLLLGLAAVTGVLIWQVPAVVPLTAMVLPMVLGSLLLGPRQLPWFVVLSLLILSVLMPVRDVDLDKRTVSAVVILFAFGFIIMLASFRRSSLGVAGVRGESMLVDLRDRILRQGGIPELPEEWYVASELRSAGGTAFAGDFVVTARQGHRLDLVVVDVSGKGEGAGTRALLLSGALGGLLGAMSPEDFLESANSYLMRQDWEEGFATAVHLAINLNSGEFEVRSAGHPPAALRAAGSGRWSVLQASGPVLGLMDDATYDPVRGTMRPGDALLLYTDGMVETRHRDIMLGVDKMLGRAELLLRGEFDDGAARLIEALGSRNDDRALVLVHRR